MFGRFLIRSRLDQSNNIPKKLVVDGEDVTVEEVAPEVFHLKFSTRQVLVSALNRFQAQYDKSQFNGVNTVTFSDYADHDRFNFSSRATKPFYSGQVDQLTEAEIAILKAFETLHQAGKPFSIIADHISAPVSTSTFENQVANSLFDSLQDLMGRK